MATGSARLLPAPPLPPAGFDDERTPKKRSSSFSRFRGSKLWKFSTRGPVHTQNTTIISTQMTTNATTATNTTWSTSKKKKKKKMDQLLVRHSTRHSHRNKAQPASTPCLPPTSPAQPLRPATFFLCVLLLHLILSLIQCSPNQKTGPPNPGTQSTDSPCNPRRQSPETLIAPSPPAPLPLYILHTGQRERERETHTHSKPKS